MKNLRIILALATTVVLLGSCKTEDPTFPFRIVAQDENGTRIQNAYIRAYVPLPNVDIEYTGTTGVSGVCNFEHTGGEIVVQIQVTKGNDVPAAIGCGYLKLEPDELVTATIVVGEYDPDDPGCQ